MRNHIPPTENQVLVVHRFFATLAFLALLGVSETILGAPACYGADLELVTAGQSSADPTPYFKESN